MFDFVLLSSCGKYQVSGGVARWHLLTVAGSLGCSPCEAPLLVRSVCRRLFVEVTLSVTV